MAKNKRKIYDPAAADCTGELETQPKPCRACGCAHFEHAAANGRAVMVCRNCGRVRP